jgi:hypothetical protein
MTSRRSSTLFSILAVALELAAPGGARAQSGFQGSSRSSSFSQFGLGYGAGIDYGTTPFSYGSLGGARYGGFVGIGVTPDFPTGLSSDQVGGVYQSAAWRDLLPVPYARPLASTALQPVHNIITSLPGWSGSTYRIRHRHKDLPSLPPAPPLPAIPVSFGVKNIK